MKESKHIVGKLKCNDEMQQCNTIFLVFETFIQPSFCIFSSIPTVLTGAGISTNAGILDFRGPKGIWTVEKDERKRMRKENTRKRRRNGQAATGINADKISNEGENCIELKNKDVMEKKESCDTTSDKLQLSFLSATPTVTHRSITRLAELGIIKYVITQNVDGLHRRSGLPRSKLAVLHGCLFTEKCDECATEYFRNFDVGGVSMQKTGRKCEREDCNGDLHDTILDWNDELPEIDWALSQEHCQHSDLVLTIGTSLRIEPGKCFFIVC